METEKKFSVPDTIAVLSRTPAILNALLRGLPETWVSSNEGGQTWNAFDILHHLILGEQTDWMARVQIILEYGERRTFDPFDRLPESVRNGGESMEQLLDDFARLRGENLIALATLSLQPADLVRKGVHPAFGVVTLSQLLATWMVHDMTHLHQVSRVMACQYRDAVGPWSAYLGVLTAAGG